MVWQRTKAMPKPGLVGLSCKTEKMKEVEKEVMFVEEGECFIGSFVGWKAQP